MVRGSRRASAPATADPHPDSTALLPPGLPPRGTSAWRGRGGGRAGTAADAVVVRRSAAAPICGGHLATPPPSPICRQCIYDTLTKGDTKCPTCNVLLGPAPLEKLSLQHIRSVIFHGKRRNVNAVTAKNKKRKEKVFIESTISSVVDIIIGGRTTPLQQKIEVELINEADEASVAKESVYESSILVTFYVFSIIFIACHLSVETGALIVWQPPPIPEEMVALAHDQLAPRQDSQTFGPPATSGISFHARMTVQDDDNLSGDILALFNESTTRIMGRYDAHISQLKGKNSKLIEQLENERAAALERIRTFEERHQQELENERVAAAERTRILEERYQQELEKERAAAAERTRILEERLQREGLENERADNQALMSDIVEKSDELATLKYHCDMFESDKKDLENQVENLKKELEYTKREHARYARQVLDAASRVHMQLAGADPCTLQ
uniref:RING-type domain-containing protein n=1 Tax=Setaria viridis TaxID=4556 RepID=A0A4U6VQL0_SETVI|nr:hypothetical protein SEVIR_2G061600v2 [Setaria viridis]